MVGLVNKRIAAFEEMARMETVEVKQTPVPKHFVGKLVSFYEHGAPSEVGKVASKAPVVQPVDEAFKAPTPASESSPYWAARFRRDNPHNQATRDGGSQEILPSEEEDEETRRRRRFIFHINAPATNISEARARARRGRGVRRARFYLARGMRILQKATERRPNRSPGSQHSQNEKSTVKNTGSVRVLANTDQSASVFTQAKSENSEDDRIGLGAEAEEVRGILGEASNRRSAISPRTQDSQHSRSEESSVKKTGRLRKDGKTEDKRSPPESTGKRSKPDDKWSSATNTVSFRGEKKESKNSSPKNTRRVRKATNTDPSTSAVTQTTSEDGDVNRIRLRREKKRRIMSLFSRMWANLSGRRERTRSSQQGIVVHQLSGRASSKSATTIPIEVNVPYPKDAIGSGNSFAATIQLKVSLTRDSE